VTIRKFTVEETNIIAMYIGNTRAETIDNIADALPQIYDEDIITIAESASHKLATLEEQEFAESSFIPADETEE
jgi:hypothetical protein